MYGKYTICQDTVDVVNQGLGIPNLESAWISQNSNSIETIWAIVEPSTETKLFISMSFNVSGDGIHGPVLPLSKPGLSSISIDGSKRAHLLNSEDESNSYIDIWNNTGLIKRFDLTCKQSHGKGYTNKEFSSLCWDPNGNKLMYLAERKNPKKCSFYNQNITEDKIAGTVFNVTESWGEQLSQCYNSVICILDTNTEEIKILEIPETIFCSKPIWSTDDIIYFIGMDTHPFKLGTIYCSNRASKLYSYDLLNDSCISITHEKCVVLSPHAEPDNKGRIVFLSCPAGGPHRNYTKISVFWPKLHYPTKPTEDTEEVPGGFITTVPDSLFCGNLSPAPWLDKNNIVIKNIIGWKSVLQKVNIISGSKEALIDTGGLDENMSYDIGDQIKSKILFSFSNFNSHLSSYKQGLGYVDLQSPEKITYLIPPTSCNSDLNYKPIEFVRDGRTFNGILIRPTCEPDTNTLVVFPHGGPHSVYTTNFRSDVYILCKLGYSLLLVNYTGSLGLGADSMGILAGNVGDMDVKDVHHAALQVGKEFCNIVVMGGSHGGFLTAHLVGQYPDFYKAAVVRNPVTDISTMVGSTDIPDWCYYESGLDYDPKYPPLPSPYHIKAMLEKSPIQYIDKVNTPFLLLIGGKDLRVPPSQGIRYYQYLKSRNVVCDLKFYPDDCHPLTTVPCDADSIMHIHLWFKKHLNL